MHNQVAVYRVWYMLVSLKMIWKLIWWRLSDMIQTPCMQILFFIVICLSQGERERERGEERRGEERREAL